MKYPVVIRPEAEGDLRDAFSWYEDKRTGLGHDFLLQVDAGLRFIQRNPESHPPEYKGARKYLTKRFPYKIIYLIENGKIIVLGVIHVKRRPAVTRKRTGNS